MRWDAGELSGEKTGEKNGRWALKIQQDFWCVYIYILLYIAPIRPYYVYIYIWMYFYSTVRHETFLKFFTAFSVRGSSGINIQVGNLSGRIWLTYSTNFETSKERVISLHKATWGLMDLMSIKLGGLLVWFVVFVTSVGSFLENTMLIPCWKKFMWTTWGETKFSSQCGPILCYAHELGSYDLHSS